MEKAELKWGLIVNPNAGSGKCKKNWPTIQKLVKRAKLETEVEFTELKSHAIELTKQFIEKGFRKIIVVGGGDSAVESAMLLMDNNEVILSYRKDKFARIKPKNKESIIEAVTNNSIEVIFNSNLESISDSSIMIKVDEEENSRKIENDLVYIFAGGELPTGFLQKAGVKITKRFGHIVKTYQ